MFELGRNNQGLVVPEAGKSQFGFQILQIRAVLGVDLDFFATAIQIAVSPSGAYAGALVGIVP